MIKKEEYHARLTVAGLPDMRRVTMKRLVKWLRNQANEFEKESPKIFSKRFTARLMK